MGNEECVICNEECVIRNEELRRENGSYYWANVVYQVKVEGLIPWYKPSTLNF